MMATVWDISDTTTFQEVAQLLSSSDGLLLYWQNIFTSLFWAMKVLELNIEHFKKLGKYTDDFELPFGLGPYGVSSDFLKICDNVWFIK